LWHRPGHANGDVANKIGTYLKALAAHDNDVPFYVALPSSTIDWTLESGRDIPIEERSEDEVLKMAGRLPDGSVTVVEIAAPARAPPIPALTSPGDGWSPVSSPNAGTCAAPPKAYGAFFLRPGISRPQVAKR
jgi:hypothetical protein